VPWWGDIAAIFSGPGGPGDRAEKTAFAAADIDISQDPAEIPYLEAPL
jgi:hypothetical protein